MFGAALDGGADRLCRCTGLWERSCASNDGSGLVWRLGEIHSAGISHVRQATAASVLRGPSQQEVDKSRMTCVKKKKKGFQNNSDEIVGAVINNEAKCEAGNVVKSHPFVCLQL